MQELWERLQIPQEERQALSEHMVKSKKKNIEAVRGLLYVAISDTSMKITQIASWFSLTVRSSFPAPGRGPASGGAENAEHEKCR